VYSVFTKSSAKILLRRLFLHYSCLIVAQILVFLVFVFKIIPLFSCRFLTKIKKCSCKIIIFVHYITAGPRAAQVRKYENAELVLTLAQTIPVDTANPNPKPTLNFNRSLAYTDVFCLISVVIDILNPTSNLSSNSNWTVSESEAAVSTLPPFYDAS